MVTRLRARRALIASIATTLVACSVSRGGSSDVVLSVAPQPTGWVSLFALPDATGQKLAILGWDRANDLRVAFSRGGKVSQLSERGLEISDMTWMPDGRLLVALGDITSTSSDLAFVDPADGKILENLDVDWDLAIDFHSMSVSPNGERVVVAAGEPGPTFSTTDLYLVDLHTGETSLISPTVTSGADEHSPAFMDSMTIAYVEGQSTIVAGSPNGVVRTLNLQTGDMTQVSRSSFVAESVSASIGSGALVYDGFMSGARSSQTVWLVEGSQSEQLALLRGPYSRPALDRDGELLVVTNSTAGKVLSGAIPH